MKIRDLVEIKDSKTVGRIIRRVRFPTEGHYNRFKWAVLDGQGRTWHKLTDELKLLESAPMLEMPGNNQLELDL